MSTVHTDVIVIGSGFAGVGTAVRLQQEGVDDLVLLEAGHDVGGTWRDNTYPGAACDIQSHLYSFSFEPRDDWSLAYAPQPEIQRYLRDVAQRHGLREKLHTGAVVTEATWCDDDRTWTVTTRDGRAFVGTALVGAIGGLRDPKVPDLPGRDRFTGPQMHSARWDHDVDLAGKRVAVVGSGASAVQVVPAIADTAERVTLVQRTPPWILPRGQHPYPEVVKRAFRRVPGLRRLHRAQLYWQNELRFAGFGRGHRLLMPLAEKAARAWLHHQVSDPVLREQLAPDYRLGCKRMLISDDWYSTLVRDDVDVVSDGVHEVTDGGLVTTAGEHVDADVIVWCTGFHVEAPLGQLTIRGRGGRTMREAWGDRPIAWMGVAVPDFPNLFLMVGPNSGLGHNSVVFMIEAQLKHVVPTLTRLVHGDLAEVDVRPSALERFRREVDRRTDGTVWTSGCDSWYLGRDGVNYTLWPGSTAEYWMRMARVGTGPYRVVRREDVSERERVPATA